ncbi:4-hydroxybenzoate polyprenyltransferase, mitochondrial-like isoform X2 [Hydractinia symbiolongicarpus]|uniref:4-hydroxybenzoate polyprenyltransferase, mitochondrial-like isoform X2 n=1 Tax=Hydractinia symbiolongicarpus TaxID=13093 RepID=UPI00254A6CA7|nr:4-hydroxybenzoate polyprenyltransferase, mitochondrial-like isoform X2 [Hydractinia symbiolongicarpus]
MITLHGKTVFRHSLSTFRESQACVLYWNHSVIENKIENKVKTKTFCTCAVNQSIHKNAYQTRNSGYPLKKYNFNRSFSNLNRTFAAVNIQSLNVFKRHSVTKALLNASPDSIKPYLNLIRFDKPIGTWLLYLPCTWSIAMAANEGCLPNAKILALFGTGAFIMRGAGCVINDMWDSEFDKKVKRTLSRPLASGEISHQQALVYLAGLLSCGLGVLLSLNWYSVFLGAASMGLVVSYPLMKRFTYWPQLFLGMALNWGAVLGWCAVRGSCDWLVCLPLYTAGVSWTIIYDTIYAHQDKDDDQLIGVKSTALLFGDHTKLWLSCFTATMTTGLCISGYFSEQLWPYYLAVAGSCSHLTWQISTVNLDDSDDCFSKFRSNQLLGAMLFFGIVASTLLKNSKKEETGVKDNE